MIQIFIALVVLVAITMSVLHLSAGVAWVVVLVAVAAIAIVGARNSQTRKITKTGAFFSSVCPYCRKRVKDRAVVCNHCGRDLVVQRAS